MHADPRFQSPGAARALGHGGLADALGNKPRQPLARIKPRGALLGGVHHQPDAFNGETGFRNIGRQHHFTFAFWCRQDRLSLLAKRQRAIQRAEQHICADARRQMLLHPQDFAHARQKQQQRSVLGTQQFRGRHGDRFLKTLMCR